MIKFKLLARKLFRLRQHYFWQDRIIFISFLVGLGLNLFFWIFILWRLIHIEEIIPLHYNIYFGVDLIGKKIQLLKMPLMGLVVLLINLFLAFKIYKHERINSYFLMIGVALIQAVLLLAGFLIVNL